MSATTGPPATWSAILADAVSKPGVISEAYSRFWSYSIGNQLLALWQCTLRGLEPGPINTFLGWKECGRFVRKGERALTLCMPVKIKAKEKPSEANTDEAEKTYTKFLYRPNWFVLSQTDGKPYEPQVLPTWEEDRALVSLGITRVPFTHPDGNAEGFASKLSVSVSPIALAPERTLFHELAHVVLGHTTEGDFIDSEQTSRSLREVEAECVALICCESLGVAGVEESRGYIQHHLRADSIPDRSAQKIFKAADKILRAGRPQESGGEA